MSIASIGSTSLPNQIVKPEPKPEKAGSTPDTVQASHSTPTVTTETPAVTLTLSSAKQGAQALKVNADGTVGPHHKARHPKLPGSFHV